MRIAACVRCPSVRSTAAAGPLRRWRSPRVANVAIVVTGGAVRLTGSGLGCPTWPRCTDESYTTTAAMGVHGVIEFGNRLLDLRRSASIALACLVLAVLQRPRAPVAACWLSLAVAAGHPGARA